MKIALSYSKLSNYEQCPRQFQSKYISKSYPDDSNNPHFVRGSRIHKQLEDYTIWKCGATETFDNMPDMSPEAMNARPIIDSLFESYDEIYPEQKVAVDVSFTKCDWFARNTYYRAVFDLVAIRGNEGLLIDWKTGKVRDYDEKDTGQLHLAAAILLSIQPKLERIKTAYMFVEHKHTISREFSRDDLDAMLIPFHDAHATVNADTEFLPLVNKYCYFCKIDPSECEYKK